MSSLSFAVVGLGSLALAACGGRAAEWDAPVGAVSVGQLRNAAVLVDQNLNRALIARASADQTLTTTAVPVGKRVALTASSPDRNRVFVISQGDPVRLGPNDEAPALTVFEASNPETPKSYQLPDPLTSLAIDPNPEDHLAIIYAGDSTDSSFLTNPNELLFVDLDLASGPDNPRPRTLPSKEGGAPKSLTFSPMMHFPSGDRRFLIVATDRDLVLLDITNPDRGPITLPLTDPHTDSRALSPAGIAVDPGDLAAMRNPHIAVRTTTDDNVLVYELQPTSDMTAGGNDFHAIPNFAPAGGVPSDVQFVRTRQGVRLAILVPSPVPRGLLVNVGDNSVLTATLSQPYQNLSLVTDLVSNASPDGDQVMLWAGGGASSVALWDLGAVPSAAQADIDTVKSIETLNLNGSVLSVMDVPDKQFQSLKVLETNGQSLYVLDLQEHAAAPLRAASQVTLRLGREGDRAWAFLSTQTDLARVSLSTAHVQTVVIDRPVDDVIEVDRTDDATARSLLVLHGLGTSADVMPQGYSSRDVGITVYDALKPDAATSRRYSALMLERLVP
jgi:hypothetical protein